MEAVAFVKGGGFEGIDREERGDGFDFADLDAVGGVADLIDAPGEAKGPAVPEEVAADGEFVYEAFCEGVFLYFLMPLLADLGSPISEACGCGALAVG